MYRKTVVVFKAIKYLGKLTDDIYSAVFAPHLLYVSVQGCLWICKTCDCTLKQGRMPAQAKANNLTLDDVPPELSDLNPMEIRLISLRIPFMKMVALYHVVSREQFMDQQLISRLTSILCVNYCHDCHLRLS